jgi:hypothetical protein
MENNNATGNRKCWKVINVTNGAVSEKLAGVRFTRKEAQKTADHLSGINGCERARVCRDGYKLIPCDGEAHSNPHIDNCGKCAPRWGFVMVPEGK